MASSRISQTLEFLLIVISAFAISSRASDPPLTLDYYESSCPNLLSIVRKEMECVVTSDPRNAALIVRLHFHDCFVQGCDGSVLLDDTVTLKGEKTASQNLNSLAGFDIIDQIKNKIESECPEIVSCADILTIAARDATILVGGPYWDVPLGRKDSKTAGFDLANENIPAANEGLTGIISKFLYQGLSVTDTVALSGAHTIGMARCENFRARVTGDYSSKSSHLDNLKKICPAAGGKEDNIAPMDYVTPALFDNSYFNLLLRGEGILNSDQELYSSLIAVQTKGLVTKYAKDNLAFFNQFAESMVKLGNITNSDSFVTGEVRKSCRFINTEEP